MATDSQPGDVPRCQVCVSHRRWNGSCVRNANPSAGNATRGSTEASGWLPASDHAQATAADTASAEAVRQTPRHTPKRETDTEKAGGACMVRSLRVDQTRLKTSVPLVPPKPKLFLTAYSIFISRAVLAQ